MKKAIAMILTLTMCLSLICLFSACKKEETTDDGKLKVVTTIFPEYDFVREIGKDKVDVTMLIRGDLHSYTPSLNDINKISNCDVFVYLGGQSYSWVKSVILDKIDTSGITMINLFDVVNKLEESEDSIIGTSDHDHDHDHEGEIEGIEYDEHIWTSVPNAKAICGEICKKLCEADEVNNNYYTDNYNAYSAKLDTLDTAMRNTVSQAKTKKIVIADKFPFLYMCKEYGIEYCAALSGCSSSADVTLPTIITLTDIIKENNIKTVLYSDYSSGTIITAVEKQLGDYKVNKAMLNSCQSVTDEMLEKGVSYVSVMYDNINVLSEAMK